MTNGATSTYGYDHATARISQTIGTSTTFYFDKLYSIASSTSTSTPSTYSNYVFAGDTLVSLNEFPTFALSSTSTPSELGAFQSINSTTVGTTTTSINLGVSSAPNRMMVLFASLSQATAGIGSIGGASITTASSTYQFTKATSTLNGTAALEIWYLLSPPTEVSRQVVVSKNGTTTGYKIVADIYLNIAQSNPIDVISGSAGSSGNPSISATTTFAKDVLAYGLTRLTTADATSTNYPSGFSYKNNSSPFLGAASYKVTTTSGGYSETYTGSTTANWVMLAVGFKPAATVYATTTSYIHTDHLNSTSLMTDSVGAAKQVLDYYPYGGQRISQSVNGADAKRRFIGQFSDNSGLSYLNARYYASDRGQFISQDPVFWSPAQNLINPQSLNSYNYANGNPLNQSDPSGRAASLSSTLSALVTALQSLLSILNSMSSGVSNSSGNSSALPRPTMVNNISMPRRTSTWDTVSNQRIQQLDPRLRDPATDFLNNTQDLKGVKLRVNEAYRSRKRQDELYIQSKTTGPYVTGAKGGESYHNYGLALDVVVMENGNPNFNKPITQGIADIGTAEGFEWGGTWPGKKQDPPHFQMTFGQSWQELNKAANN